MDTWSIFTSVVSMVSTVLVGIILNLLTLSGYYDVALRDFGLLVAAVALARLARKHA